MVAKLTPELRNELQDIRYLLWGSYVNPDIFKRWSQGFYFSQHESSALEQRDGGPCAVIAPVQAFILKTILNQSQESMFASITKEKQDYLLINALCDILSQCSSSTLRIVYLNQNINEIQNSIDTNQLSYNSQDSNREKSNEEKQLPIKNVQNEIRLQNTPETKSQVTNSKSEEEELSRPTIEANKNLDNRENQQRNVEILENQNCGFEVRMELSEHNASLESVTMDETTLDAKQIDKDSNEVGLAETISEEPKDSNLKDTNLRVSEPISLTDSDMLEIGSNIQTVISASCGTSKLLGDIKKPLDNVTYISSDHKCTSPPKSPKLALVDFLNSPVSSPRGQITEENVITPEVFHDNLAVIELNSIDEVEKFFRRNINFFKNEYGVLIFLYTVILTKGIEQVKQELSDTSEPLIHETYGYGSQGLINLMLTGRSVGHVWDNEQDIGGLKLKGIDKQSQVGFITLMEHMRYCTVGSFYKSPRFPVWVMGSETHLTVLFSFEKRLVSPESPSETARRIFKSFDPDGNNFISSVLLQDVLQALGLVSEPAEYIEIMKKKLDAENLGIILLNAFLEEFYPNDKPSTPDMFTLWHYNGLQRSNIDNKVRYNKGHAILLECDLKSICESNPMLTCLQTKWPNIEVSWVLQKTPSLN